ncbi:glycosyltransferase family 4 protein [Bacteroides nordii]|uniref:glycosyltransferase family 4 protein n=1 Tax=Bacteroides nordii TaxID=291645 RepID=UPI001E61CF94|nr:glycosyltransferase family 4 protein [Bacteroides nordii]
MKCRNLTLIFNNFEEEHFGKDVFLLPYYLGKQYKCDVTIVYLLTATNRDFPAKVRGVNLCPLKGGRECWGIWSELVLLRYLLIHVKDIDVLMRFHYTFSTFLMTYLYKLFNRNGKVYVKADLDVADIAELKQGTGMKSLIRTLFYPKGVESLDVFSCETLATYKTLLDSTNKVFRLESKLVLLPNGFDEEFYVHLGLKERTFVEKENIMITVGRLGTRQKNTELLLKALESVVLKDWKIYLIGPIEESFKSVISDFYLACPDKRKSVIFLGAIYDKQKLWEYYNKAKCFVFTSRYESYGLVLNEAKRFRNYIISTNVGAFQDLFDNGKYGIEIPQNNDIVLTHVLQKIIDGCIDINVYHSFDVSTLSWDYLVKKIQL